VNRTHEEARRLSGKRGGKINRGEKETAIGGFGPGHLVGLVGTEERGEMNRLNRESRRKTAERGLHHEAGVPLKNAFKMGSSGADLIPAAWGVGKAGC